MTNRHGGIGPFSPLHEHVGHRLADNVAAAHNHDMPAGDFNLVPQQQLLNAVGRTWQKSRRALH